MADEYNPIENLTRDAESITRLRTGEAWNPHSLLENLPHHDLNGRVEILREFDIVLDHMDTSDLRRYSELSSLRKKADDLHHKLRRAGR
jgi:hypothetical protein